ncbi:MAG: hypothetical protein CMC35_03540 [Flavobacteriaceae bacterium]|nr:hypothetical protein [Flavobacteriaceae bacterium]|tara:strand:+ start:2637 stop:3368 length:732 start_codon:yes stop_codon:yes gene_type:complete
MKLKITTTIFLLSIGCNLIAQCDLPSATQFTGPYYVYQVEPGLLGYNAFNASEEPELITIENGGADHIKEFTTVYLPDAEIGQPARTFQFEFKPDCGVTLTEEFLTGLMCVNNLKIGPAGGGDYDSSDDSEFTLVLTDNTTEDCEEPQYIIEIRFSRDNPLDVPKHRDLSFSYHVNSERQLVIESTEDRIGKLVIYNISGQTVVLESPDSDWYQKDLSALPSGIYFVRASTPNGLRQIFKISI